MTGTHPWDDAPRDEPIIVDLSRFDPTTKAGKKALKDAIRGKSHGKKDREPKKAPIPVLPDRKDVATGDEIRAGVSERARAAANLKVEGYSYQEIAETLEFENAAKARAAVEGVLAQIHGPGEYETLRLVAGARAEAQFKRSSAMAGAAFLQDKDTGDLIPNVDQRGWHAQAGVDLMNWAKITGAVAPTKLEITPGEEQMEKILGLVLKESGHEDIIDAEVIELEYVAPPKELEELNDDGDDA